MRAVDTNVLVRLLARDDPKQAARSEEFIGAGAWVSHIVLVECMWVLESVYERSPKQIATAVEMLLSHESLALQDLDVVERALESFRTRPKVGFSDCLIVEVARKAGHTPLGTFDRDLAKIEGTERL
jgi:predicted nucleic-acid-binding protein